MYKTISSPLSIQIDIKVEITKSKKKLQINRIIENHTQNDVVLLLFLNFVYLKEKCFFIVKRIAQKNQIVNYLDQTRFKLIELSVRLCLCAFYLSILSRLYLFATDVNSFFVLYECVCECI